MNRWTASRSAWPLRKSIFILVRELRGNPSAVLWLSGRLKNRTNSLSRSKMFPAVSTVYRITTDVGREKGEGGGY